jgi:hypothetical protein
MEVSGQIHAKAALFREKSRRYQFHRRRSGPPITRREISLVPAEERNPIRRSISPSLYRLSYSGSLYTFYIEIANMMTSKTFEIISLLHITRRPITVDLGHELSSPARTLGSWVRIPLKACMAAFILCLCFSVCR